jgi:hypothetical protein
MYDYVMKIELDNLTKAERREKKKRPRMAVHGQSLKRPNKFAGMKLAKTKKK